MFGSRLGLSGSADRMALGPYFRFDQIQDGSRPPSWKITAASRGFPATAWLSCWNMKLNTNTSSELNKLYK